MIEKLFRSELARKRWRRFRANRIAVVSVWILLALMFFSATAELWANSSPLILRYHGKTYVPVVKYYHPTEFGRDDIAQMDYRGLELAEGDWAIWPLIKWDPFERNEKLNELPAPPSSENLLGTDDSGRDVASRLLYGFRYSFMYSLGVWLLSSIIGALLGAWMGFKGGWVDLVGQRVIEILESLPYLMILITLVSIFKPDLWLLIIFTVFFGWVGVSLYFRGEFLKLRRREFVEAARALGAGSPRLIVTHVLPNSLTPWITLSPFLIAGYISGLAALDYLGFGLPPPTPSWGELLNQAQKYFRIAWWLAVFPSLALFITLTVLNFIGEAARDALDPRKT
jgi:microcin C transport system permease protein